ncbi:uncharacterized protein CTHT_0014540 [Thermochaetoides thermophila DSM 1495]|uniref:Mediator of RNA polymerase II transcription subunit 17 n=1 Tax=Chaetomium thermophilum (strain DSM 1495 / CBS 144.50 / IMI 039719) TaxID=759272 RepID=G0S1R5_CHATD|nr:hypothetical protein CTHT_0014540 [Thermochaetoides thermophila DSM 1495]EGS22975.1 hypothetical protein CTHT_0014540 [Thermochaetoides thermophila DSM 1495]6XP5_Q Chain Q, Mediator of RNA polymerase II transcription subunit 17 [Thermochaetoides thermophila DSM 1495]
MTDRPFILQVPPTQQRGPQNIAEFVARINPDAFRVLNEAELRRKVEEEKNGVGQDEDVDMESSPSDNEGEPADAKDIITAKHEMLRVIDQTRQTTLYALDFVSLLLSKENPGQAVTTFSPGLRELVGIGTLGATMLDAPTPLTQSRIPDNKLVTIGKRLMDLNKAADTALAASKRLQKEIAAETKYWSEVLAVRNDGWQTSRMPREPQTMGVKFGFNNAAPEFKAVSIAPMRRADNGSVLLDRSSIGHKSQRIQVRILEDGRIVGRSSLPSPVSADAPLQDRVKEMRDTIFAQELWHEINREARTLLNQGVHLEPSSITYTMDASTTVSIRLATLGEEEEGLDEQQEGPQDVMAESLNIALSLLLSHAHRMNELRRSEPGINKGPPRTYPILLPLISYHKYNQSIQTCLQTLSAHISVLRSASVDSSMTVKEPLLSSPPGAPAATSLYTILTRPPAVQFDITITPDSRIRILLKPTQLTGAAFSICCLPALHPGAQNPLATTCPPSTDDYDSLTQVVSYLQAAIPRALAAHYEAVLVVEATVNGGMLGDLPPSPSRWMPLIDGKGIVDPETMRFGIRFSFGRNPAKGGQLELGAQTDYVDGSRKRVRRNWIWPGAQSSLDSVAKHVLARGPPEE